MFLSYKKMCSKARRRFSSRKNMKPTIATHAPTERQEKFHALFINVLNVCILRKTSFTWNKVDLFIFFNYGIYQNDTLSRGFEYASPLAGSVGQNSC